MCMLCMLLFALQKHDGRFTFNLVNASQSVHFFYSGTIGILQSINSGNLVWLNYILSLGPKPDTLDSAVP